MPIGLRVIIGAIALLPLIWPAWDLKPWTIPFGVIAVFTWVIVLGAMALGSAILLIMIFSPNTELRLSDEGIDLARQSVFGSYRREIDPNLISEISVHTTDWSDGPDTYSLKITLRDSRPFFAASSGDQAEVEQMASDAQAAVRLLQTKKTL